MYMYYFIYIILYYFLKIVYYNINVILLIEIKKMDN